MLAIGSGFPIPSQPSTRMRLKPLKPFGKPRPGTWLQFKKLRLHALLLSMRWKPPVWITYAPCNKLTRTEGPRKEAHQGGEKRLPMFPNHLWSSTAVMPPEAHLVLMYPLQLLMGNISLAALLAISPQPSTKWGSLLLHHPPNHIGGTYTPLGNQMVMPFT